MGTDLSWKIMIISMITFCENLFFNTFLKKYFKNKWCNFDDECTLLCRRIDYCIFNVICALKIS